jgi:hypothetical protein
LPEAWHFDAENASHDPPASDWPKVVSSARQQPFALSQRSQVAPASELPLPLLDPLLPVDPPPEPLLDPPLDPLLLPPLQMTSILAKHDSIMSQGACAQLLSCARAPFTSAHCDPTEPELDPELELDGLHAALHSSALMGAPGHEAQCIQVELHA